VKLKAVFWNTEEQRLRAGWRVVGQAVGWLAVMAVVQGLISMALRTMLAHPSEINVSTRQLVGMTAEVINYLILIATVALAARILDRRGVADLGLRFSRSWWIDFGFGLVLGIFLMTAIFLAELAAGWVTITGTLVVREGGLPFWPGIILPLIGFLAVGVGEELWSRGYVLTNLAEGLRGGRLSPVQAIALATLFQGGVFALLHANNPNASVVSTVNILLISFLLALGFILTGELAIPIGLHITWNFFQGVVFGFPVSGNGYLVGTFIGTTQSGPTPWTGGAFGPEAGLVALAAVLLGALLVLLWVRFRHGTLRWSRGIAEFSVSLARNEGAVKHPQHPAAG
jgi:membrane protease YdiL (CAAX protease family)